MGFVLMVINRLSAPGAAPFHQASDRQGDQQAADPTAEPLVGAVLAATLMQGMTSFSLTQLLSKSRRRRLIAELRQKVQRHIGRLPVAYYDANKSGVLVSRIMSDVEGMRNLIGTGLVDFVGGLLTALIRPRDVCCRISPLMTGLTSFFVVAFSLHAEAGVHQDPSDFPRARQDQRGSHRASDRIARRRARGQGIPCRRARGRGFRGRRAAAAGQRAQIADRHVLDEPFGNGADGNRGRGGVVSWGRIRSSPGALSLRRLDDLHRVSGVPDRAGDAGGEHRHAVDRSVRRAGAHSRSAARAAGGHDPKRTVALGTIRGEVEFRDVGFSYEPGKQVLYDVSFRAEPGTVTALVGPSGSGKSTIISLIAAFHTPTKARSRWMAWISPPCGWIPIARSWAWCCRTRSCSTEPLKRTSPSRGPARRKEQILEACRIARVDEFAENFEKKYDTIVGERGVKLSGGQRQRVSIARAILADPRILILDEATSSLDSESEALIQEGLKYLMKGRTTFVIAHRLSTIRRADQILVVEAGGIVERGTHDQLYALGGRYWDLYTRQHGLEANLFLAPGEGDAVEEKNGGKGEAKEAAAITEAMRLIRG